jgi:hypothetical protein
VLILLQWAAEQLLPMFDLDTNLVTSPSYGDFASLALCNQELHNVGRQGSFIKLYEQGCNEKYDEWREK